MKFNYQGDIVEIHVRDSSMKLLQFIRFEIGNIKEASRAMWVLRNKYGMRTNDDSDDDLSGLDLKI